MNISTNHLPIGVFDSGFGGLTVLRALRNQLPYESLIYLGDTARVPYGTKSADTVIRYAHQIADFLIAKKIKYLIVACNTASAHAIESLREKLSIPVLGVVAPGAQQAAALSREGKIGVLATLGTVNSGAYQRAMHALRPDLTIFSQPCPLLVSLVEEGWVTHPVTKDVIKHYLVELRTHSTSLDTLVLGCTHYPLLKNAIKEIAEEIFGHPITLIDSAEATAQAAAADLINLQLESSQKTQDDQLFFTDVNRFDEIATAFLGRKVEKVQQADL